MEAIDKTDSAAVLEGLAVRLASAGGEDLERIAAGLEAHGQRVEAARARADARMNQRAETANNV